jgi:hypothetical protein
MDQNHSSISRSHLRGPLDDHIHMVDEGERSSLLMQAAHPEVNTNLNGLIMSRMFGATSTIRDCFQEWVELAILSEVRHGRTRRCCVSVLPL